MRCSLPQKVASGQCVATPGHAKEARARHFALPRVSRLLSLLFGQRSCRMAEADNARPADYLYPFEGIRNRLLFTGCRSDGEQFLVGPYSPAVLVLRFAPTGQLLGVVEEPLAGNPKYDALERAVDACFRRLGAVPGPICMRRFSSEDSGNPLAERGIQVEICDWPLGLEDSSGWSLVEQDSQERAAERDRWLQSGAYVLEWGDSLYVGGDGAVFST
jgi:hypothetical protein